MLRFAAFRPWLRHRPTITTLSPRTRRVCAVTFGVTVATVGALALSPPIQLDAPQDDRDRTVVDSATGIAFPKTLRIPSRFPLPQYTLLGVGVRKVSLLSIKVYSVGFFADLTNVPPISRTASVEEKIKHIVEHSSCVLRIIPTRSTSYSHLRDGFMRALQARMVLQKSKGLLTAHEEFEATSPLFKLKSVFPNTSITKHTPLDVILTAPADPVAPVKDATGRERRLIVRDLGSISNDWVAKEFMLVYFEDQGISPPLKQAVEESLKDFGN